MRERIAFGVLVIIMIFLFAFVFAILGRGEYDPSSDHGASQPIVSYTIG
ncbi:MAG: hypothetical protein ACFB50_07680 [Rubrobacteraceae bacterium]